MTSSTKPQADSLREKLASRQTPTSASGSRFQRLSPEAKDRVLEQFKKSLQDRPFSETPAKDDMPPLRSRSVN
jgi:hypothetical protein